MSDPCAQESHLSKINGDVQKGERCVEENEDSTHLGKCAPHVKQKTFIFIFKVGIIINVCTLRISEKLYFLFN